MIATIRYEQKQVPNKKNGQMEWKNVKFIDEIIESEDRLREVLSTPKQFEILRSTRSRDVPEEVKKLIKKGLVQLVTVPGNEDGTLAGCQVLSNCVNLDVDYIPIEVFPKLVGNILSKAEEAALMMLHKSASEKQDKEGNWCLGLHIIGRRDPNQTQEENLRRLANIFGVEYDENAKDWTRVLFSASGSKEDLIYVSPELFEKVYYQLAEGENLGNIGGKKKRGRKKKLTTDNEQLTTNSEELKINSEQLTTNSEEPSEQSLMKFDAVVNAMGLHLETLDDEGSRHGNVNQLLPPLAKIMSRPQLEACFARRMPSFMDEPGDEFMNQVEYFYNLDADKGFLSKELQQINVQFQTQTNALCAATATVIEEEIQPILPKKLPRVIELLLKPFEEKFHGMLAIAAPAYLAALASHFRTRSNSNKVIAPNLYVAVALPSGRGKAQVQDLFEMILGKTLITAHNEAFRIEEENREEIFRCANNRDKPKRIKVKKYLAQQASKTAIMEIQKNLGKEGMVLLNFSEAKQLVAMNKQSWSNLIPYLLDAWDGAYHNQSYAKLDSVNFNGNVRATMVLTGVISDILKGINPNTSDGMTFRTITYIADVPFSIHEPVITPLSNEEQDELDNLLMSVWQKNLECADDETIMIQLPKTRQMVLEWEEEQGKRLECGELTMADMQSFTRIGQMMLRAALSLVAIHGKESKVIIDFVKWLGETAWFNSRKFFGKRIAEDLKQQQEMAGFSFQTMIGNENIAAMPKIFNRKYYYNYCEAKGIKPATAKKQLNRAVKPDNPKKKPELRYLGNDLFERI